MYASTFALVSALFASVALAAPTPSADAPPTGVSHSKVTHSVVAGLGGLVFSPDNIVAQVGEIVEFHYLPKNHSVVQSSFDKPCVPLDGGFFSGFQPIAAGQSPNVFQIEVKDLTPIWFYCSQTTGNHCQSGMNGVINQKIDSGKTLSAYRTIAAGTGTSVSPPTVQGGSVIINPNPLGGF